MKWLYIILSIYVVSLSVLPCADEAGDVNAINASVADHGDTHDDNCSDDCSPFCSCSCCGVSINYFLSKAEINTPNYFSQFIVKMLYLQHIQSGFSGSVWQPPKSEA